MKKYHVALWINGYETKHKMFNTMFFMNIWLRIELRKIINYYSITITTKGGKTVTDSNLSDRS